LYKENNDTVGYIRIGDTKVDYPVMHTDNNGYYLKFDFYGNSSKGGAIYADCNNRFKGLDISDNTVLYGHNITTGNYFASLTNYYTTANGLKSRDASYYKKYPIINFDTLYEKAEWKVFACALFNAEARHGELFPYWTTHDFDDADHFNEFVLGVMDRSVIFTDVDLEYGDKLLTLSTCYYPMGNPNHGGVDCRVVVFARKVREGESSHVDIEKAESNPYVWRFDKEREMYGNTWIGRVWDYETYLNSYNEE
jgi:sortase B